MKKIITATTSAALISLGTVASQAATLTVDSAKESHVRESQSGTNQGQERLIFGAQGNAGSEFHVMMQFSLASLVTTAGGAPITIDSVNLDLGDAFTWSGTNTASDFELREWAVDDFDVTDNTWNDPQGSAGSDATGGGTLGSLLSSEHFDNTTAEGNFIFGSEAAFVTFLQNAYDSDTVSGATVNFLVVMKDDGTYENAIPRTDSGPTTGIGTADLNITYTTVPEPSAAALLGLGGLALILRRKK